MPEVSIIVPVYNVEKYLKQCIDSILVQTFGDFELILVDDGSPDKCPEICDEYAKKDGRVKVIHKENGGLSSARNAGMKIARGKYILFCDSDDYVNKEWCASLMDTALKVSDSFIFGQIIRVRDGIKYTQSITADLMNSIPREEFLKLHIEARAGFVWNALFCADILKEHSIEFSTKVVVEDLPFCLEYIKHVSSLTFCESAEYYYVSHGQETQSTVYRQDMFRKYREKYSAVQTFIEECVPDAKRVQAKTNIANNYMFYFLQSLENTFDKRSKLSFFGKLRYNQATISSCEFQDCLKYYDAGQENEKYLSLLGKGNYFIVFLYVSLIKIKNSLTKFLRGNSK